MNAGNRSHWTVGDIAEHYGVANYRVDYITRTRDIEPDDWIGGYRVWGPDKVWLIGKHLSKEIDDATV